MRRGAVGSLGSCGMALWICTAYRPACCAVASKGLIAEGGRHARSACRVAAVATTSAPIQGWCRRTHGRTLRELSLPERSHAIHADHSSRPLA